MMRRIYTALAAAALLFAARPADAASTLCGTVTTITSVSHQWLTQLGTGCTFTQSQPAVTDLANVTAGTVLGNATGSSAAPTATAAPVLGVASTTSGSLGFYNSGSANAVTVQAPSGATAAYNFNLPIAPGTAGQALVSEAGGSTPMQWATIASATFTVSSHTTAFNATSAQDSYRYDNLGASGSVIATLPASPVAGDNWCFLVAAAQTLEILANTGETINYGGAVSASAGNIQAGSLGFSACLYFESATAAYVYTSTGAWQVT